MATKANRYEGIDGLKAYAIIGIALMHVLANGEYGIGGFVFEQLIPAFTNLVFLFMMVSGFGMCCGYYQKIVDQKISVEDFYKKRYIKIWPYFALLCALDFIMSPSKESMFDVFANLTLCQGLLPNAKICYECPYKSVIHPGDITIADYWGIEKAAPEFDDNKGVSLVLVNNEAGEKIFEKVKKRLIWKQTKLEDSMQPPLKAPFPKPDNREQFWSDFENKSFEYVAKKYGGIGLKNDAKLLLRKIKRKIKKLVVKGGKRDSNII